ncbi:hypothetical protein PFICI_13058 [Pestalotiopsis fici W106-1]|uniref:F-box domain-containing protein n=1 Tax=Pestalotiopsis fici (strain W106-1 / CGMCC3.15140) TaxID=1229662 RepID=W3WLD2_PESFW|nr:uncharacterized protein PFICI_13058 [Pestalotiopsis fici W106-1]ETS74574.1 hypothetical protein PFICI_13058 [Pestalotiopsis fici W106-1]
MPDLGTLPNELLHLIAGSVIENWVAETRDYSKIDEVAHERGHELAEWHLSKLSRTSRHFHQIFNPYLYQSNRDHRASYAVGWAVQHRSFETLEKSLSYGLDINRHIQSRNITMERRDLGNQPLSWVFRPIELAVARRHRDILKWLLDHGADPDPGRIEDDLYGNEDARSRGSNTLDSPLHQVLGGTHDEEAALMLIDHGARVYFVRPTDLDSREVDMFTTALHLASLHGLSRVVKRLLLDSTIEIDYRDYRSLTALRYAVTSSHSRVATINSLLQHGANPTSKGVRPFNLSTMLEAAIHKGSLENVLALMQGLADYLPPRKAPRSWSYCYLSNLIAASASRMKDFEFPHGDGETEEITAILTKLVHIGVDFNNPPPPYERSDDDDDEGDDKEADEEADEEANREVYEGPAGKSIPNTTSGFCLPLLPHVTLDCIWTGGKKSIKPNLETYSSLRASYVRSVS